MLKHFKSGACGNELLLKYFLRGAIIFFGAILLLGAVAASIARCKNHKPSELLAESKKEK